MTREYDDVDGCCYCRVCGYYIGPPDNPTQPCQCTRARELSDSLAVQGSHVNYKVGAPVPMLAAALIKSIEDALNRGSIHRDRAGNVLNTTRDVVECLLREGGVNVEDP